MLPSGPRIGVVLSLSGTRAELKLGSDLKTTAAPLRELVLLARLPIDWPRERRPKACKEPPWQLDDRALAPAGVLSRELATAWLLLNETAAATSLSLTGLVDLIGDSTDPALCAACWHWLERGQTLFRRRHQQLEPRSLADLRQLRHERRRQRLEQQRQIRWRETLRLRQPIRQAELNEQQQNDLQLLRRWASGNIDIPLPEPLLRLLHDCRCAAEPGAIRHLLADLGLWKRHHLPSLEASTWQQGFSQELISEADQLVARADEEWPGDEHRRDLTAQRVITIDDEDTLEIDDGLALEWLDRPERARLWIHIADPGRLVESESPLDREAARRASSLYLAQGSLPMFPPRLAHGPMSLRAGQRCAAWSLWVDLDGEGGVIADGLERSWIRPAYRLSYDDVDALLELAPPQERDLLAMADLLSRRQRWRLERGALQLEDPEGRIRARDQGGELQAELEVIEPSPARRLVAEAMVLAGALVAARAQRERLCLPFRSQAMAELPDANELAQLPAGPVRHAAIKRCLSRGQVGTCPSPHFSLGLPAYVQATSPIRRYGDLLVQRQLRCLLEGTPALNEPRLAEWLQDLEGPLRQGLQIQREDQRHWLQVWFEQQPRRPLAALFLRWLRADQLLGLVWLEDLCLSLPCPCPARSEPGGKLLVRVIDVDALRDRLKLEACA